MPGETHRVDVYGRFRIEVVRHDGRWVLYRLGEGTRRPDETIALPGDVGADELAGVLEDLLHEYARPTHSLRRLDD